MHDEGDVRPARLLHPPPEPEPEDDAPGRFGPREEAWTIIAILILLALLAAFGL